MIRTEIDETKLDSGFPYCLEEGEGGCIPIDMLSIYQLSKQYEELCKVGPGPAGRGVWEENNYMVKKKGT